MKLQFDEKQTGKNIKAYRKQWGWSKKELAERAGVDVVMVDYYEKCPAVMNLYTIIPIANALNVHPGRLLAWKPKEEERQENKL